MTLRTPVLSSFLTALALAVPTARAAVPAPTDSMAGSVAKPGKSVPAKSTPAKSAPALVQPVPLSPAQLALAERVHTGQMPCEMGQHVTLTPDAHAPGHFHLHLHKLQYRMVPVETTTGAIRLEDTQAGAVWLQLGNKSMLMNQKLGKRLADECMSPAQVAVAQALKQNPAPSVLDSPTKP